MKSVFCLLRGQQRVSGPWGSKKLTYDESSWVVFPPSFIRPGVSVSWESLMDIYLREKVPIFGLS